MVWYNPRQDATINISTQTKLAYGKSIRESHEITHLKYLPECKMTVTSQFIILKNGTLFHN
jgi:hypothetical protein